MLTAIDLFSGVGGSTIGAKNAGITVKWAGNHNPKAVEFHKKNHPETEHSVQDLQQADWSEVPAHDILLASPCCQGHTKARGKNGPHHHKSRSTAMAVISCAEFHRPELIFVENVVEFLKWELFDIWSAALELFGYSISININDTAALGVPQHRNRAYLIATRSAKPIDITPQLKQFIVPEQRYISANDIIDWDSGNWSLINKPGRSPKTLARVERGRFQFGNRFVMPYYGSGSGLTGRDLNRPIGTITTRARWAVVDGDRMRMFTVNETRKAMSFPDDILLPKQQGHSIQFLGNATCPVAVSKILKATLQTIGVQSASQVA